MVVSVGNRVRVRVSGRRLRGYVTATFDADPGRKLLPIDGLSGQIPSFDASSLESLRWAATHYVTPLSVILKRSVPPNVPQPTASWTGVTRDSRRGSVQEHLPVFRVGATPFGPDVASSIKAAADDRRSVVVIAPSVREVTDMAAHLADLHGDRVVTATSSMSARSVTRSWVAIATREGTILVGTREVALWPFGDVDIVVVVEDGRRVMRSPSTPTLGVREVILHRSRVEPFRVVFHGPVPTLETLAALSTVEEPPGRQWPMIEVVDRGEDPPGTGMLAERTKAAIRSVASEGAPVFVLVGSRGYAPAFRCVSCGDVQRCSKCGSAASRGSACRRCGERLTPCKSCGGTRLYPLGAGIGSIVDDIGRFVDSVGRQGDKKLVTVGSERDLVDITKVALSVAVDVDGLAMAPHYRAAEDAFRLLVRLAQTVMGGRGRRCIVQTALRDQDVVDALVSGRSRPFLEGEMKSRERFGFPPVGSLLAIEVDRAEGAQELLTKHIGSLATILGPAPAGDRTRWLLQGRNLDAARIALRPVVNTLRSHGARVRVDVDPIDL